MDRIKVVLWALVMFAVCSFYAGKVYAEDNRSFALTSKAWDSMAAQKYDEALKSIDYCLKLYEAEAKKMQASLSDYPSNNPKSETEKYWALNDVCTCLFIKGQIMEKKGNTKEAVKAYKRCLEEFKFGQCWDTKGWFWKPAEAAKKKIAELAFDEE